MKIIKNIIWLAKHKEQLENILNKKSIANNKQKIAYGPVNKDQEEYILKCLNKKEN